MMNILVVNGPNLNLLGSRETQVYGRQTLEEVASDVDALAQQKNVSVRWVQSNHEGELIEYIHQASSTKCAGIIINPAGYGHTSVALRDALLAVSLPSVEIHLTNIAKREDFRHRTLTADVTIGQVSGFGAYGYQLALLALIQHLSREEN